jgi:8-oxo-dGTP diphosphatase
LKKRSFLFTIILMSSIGQIDLRYTLCFLTRGDEILMLFRQNPPNKGLWNGVGGRLLPEEAPLAGCLREVYEETGYRLAHASFTGLVTWEGFETPPGGLYVFVADAPAGAPLPCAEGELAWKPRRWVFSSPEVVSNIHIFGPLALNGCPPQTYHFVYQDGHIVRYAYRPLPAACQVV